MRSARMHGLVLALAGVLVSGCAGLPCPTDRAHGRSRAPGRASPPSPSAPRTRRGSAGSSSRWRGPPTSPRSASRSASSPTRASMPPTPAGASSTDAGPPESRDGRAAPGDHGPRVRAQRPRPRGEGAGRQCRCRNRRGHPGAGHPPGGDHHAHRGDPDHPRAQPVGGAGGRPPRGDAAEASGIVEAGAGEHACLAGAHLGRRRGRRLVRHAPRDQRPNPGPAALPS